MSRRSFSKETIEEVDLQDNPGDYMDDEDMDALLAQFRRKKPCRRKPLGEETKSTPLLEGKTSLRPQQHSRSTSLSPGTSSCHTAPKEFYTPKRHPLLQESEPRPGRSCTTKNNSQRDADSVSGSPLQYYLPSPPSTDTPPASRDRMKKTPPETNSESELSSSSLSEEEGHEIGRQDKGDDQREKSGVSRALKDMTSITSETSRE